MIKKAALKLTLFDNKYTSVQSKLIVNYYKQHFLKWSGFTVFFVACESKMRRLHLLLCMGLCVCVNIMNDDYE